MARLLTRAVRGIYTATMNHFITIRTYGTWLHGDARGSVDRNYNVPGSKFRPPSEGLERYERERMQQSALILSDEARLCVEEAMRGVAAFRDWTLRSVNVRTNHVHLFLATGDEVSGDKVMNDMKARATFCLREQNIVDSERIVWARGGSKKAIAGDWSIERIAFYIEKCQNRPPDEA